MSDDVWVVVGSESTGLRRIEQASGGPVIHFIDASEQPVEVVLAVEHWAALQAAWNDALDAWTLANGWDKHDARCDALIGEPCDCGKDEWNQRIDALRKGGKDNSDE